VTTDPRDGLRRPPGRYGPERKGPPIITIALVSVLAVAFVSGVLVTALRLADPPVTAQLRGYDVVADDRIEVTLLVRVDDGAAATCILRARDREGREVGRVTVEIPAGQSETIVTETFPTSGRAILGEIQECRVL
jgi:uncharacterized protein (DUF58 family)